MKNDAAALERVIRGIRECFGRLRAMADFLHEDLGVTAAMRAVMESLAEHAATVPEIARSKRTSRQNIQIRVDALVAAGLCEQRANPAHRRSLLVALTDRGRATFAEMARRERAVIAVLARDFDPSALAAAETALVALADRLAKREADSIRAEGEHRACE